MTELKPCPFCGGTARMLSAGSGYKVYCSNPECKVSPQSWGEQSYKDAMEVWNSRTNENDTGEWIKISPANIYECSKCHGHIMTQDIDCFKYCHRCGKKMRIK